MVMTSVSIATRHLQRKSVTQISFYEYNTLPNNFPEFSPNLVTALASLNMDNFSHYG